MTTNKPAKKALELENKVYTDLIARKEAARQKEANETAEMFNETEPARPQAENKQLRAACEPFAAIWEAWERGELRITDDHFTEWLKANYISPAIENDFRKLAAALAKAKGEL